MFNLNFITEALSAIKALAAELGALSSVGPGHVEAAHAKLTSIAGGLETGLQVVSQVQAAAAAPSVETIAPVAEAVVGIAAPQAAPLVEAGVALAEAVEHAFAHHPASAAGQNGELSAG